MQCARCRRGTLEREWGGIEPQYYCDKCGAVFEGSEVHNTKHNNDRVIRAAKYIWAVLDRDVVYVVPFLETVRLALRIPRITISKSTLAYHGWIVEDGKMYRKDYYDREGHNNIQMLYDRCRAGDHQQDSRGVVQRH